MCANFVLKVGPQNKSFGSEKYVCALLVPVSYELNKMKEKQCNSELCEKMGMV